MSWGGLTSTGSPRELKPELGPPPRPSVLSQECTPASTGHVNHSALVSGHQSEGKSMKAWAGVPTDSLKAPPQPWQDARSLLPQGSELNGDSQMICSHAGSWASA